MIVRLLLPSPEHIDIAQAASSGVKLQGSDGYSVPVPAQYLTEQ
jgi:hypothetical protein